MGVAGIQFGQRKDDQLEVTMRGDATAIMKVLVKGLELADLRRVDAAMQAELKRRAAKKSKK